MNQRYEEMLVYQHFAPAINVETIVRFQPKIKIKSIESMIHYD